MSNIPSRYLIIRCPGGDFIPPHMRNFKSAIDKITGKRYFSNVEWDILLGVSIKEVRVQPVNKTLEKPAAF